MKNTTLALALLVLGGVTTTAASAQQQQQTQQSQASNNSSQAAGDNSQYSGVSNPPNTVIMANESMSEPTQQQIEQSQQPIFRAPKPSPATPMKQNMPANASTYMNPTPGLNQGQGYAGSGPAQNGAPNSVQDQNPSKWNNTDYGVITRIEPASETNPPIPCCTRLLTRQNSAYGVLNTIPYSNNMLNAGTSIPVELLQTISSNSTPMGTVFHAAITANIYRGGEVIIPAGAQLVGVVTSVHAGHRLIERASVRLTPQYILMPDGTSYQLDAQVVHSAAAHTNTDQEGVIHSAIHWTKDSVEYGVGAGAGALAGAQIAGPEGALVGSLIGAGAITTHLLVNQPSQVVLPRDTQLVFSLMEPMPLTATRN